ncbi:anaphase-promoting complex, subunit 10-domain-containing protein [Annulohypoxylon maeteangense]|uniref:anaphase-promoting complex, subunit 10-domain-containing protein n=1 Tax=Annulohypoxylon maeteangense TaxID=1927788 RepID=UPI00200749AE|nr:anaphase-promoting complex, subunit 10-domain-containing protein [Annulohypoxylon maeteangense]KAI0880126.1 anaphase-promoting complex, subunit 10-domain-containing protein [Annulohypoxylon maeteangense]
MEPQDLRNSGGSGRSHASLRQQQEEFRRRLMRPDRFSRQSHGRSGDPVRAGVREAAEPLTELHDVGRAEFFPTPQDHTATEGNAERVEYADDGDDDIEDDDQENEEDNGEEEEEEEDDDEEEEEEGHDDVPFDASAVGLKEISNLASFTVSSYKPGCGVKELRDDDVNQFWQSDGPQPHRLNIHFIKRVEIRVIRLYLDYELDESYTPTKIQITGGWGPSFTIPFTTMELNMPKGWIDVPVAGAGGGPDGNSMCCWFVRIIVLENHQNGKDTHIRGIKVYALDDAADTAENNPLEEMVDAIDDFDDRMELMNIHDHDEGAVSRIAAAKKKRKESAKKYTPGDGGLTIPDFMREPEIR